MQIGKILSVKGNKWRRGRGVCYPRAIRQYVLMGVCMEWGVGLRNRVTKIIRRVKGKPGRLRCWRRLLGGTRKLLLLDQYMSPLEHSAPQDEARLQWADLSYQLRSFYSHSHCQCQLEFSCSTRLFSLENIPSHFCDQIHPRPWLNCPPQGVVGNL